MGYLCFMVYGGVLVIVPNIASYLMYVHRTYGPNKTTLIMVLGLVSGRGTHFSS